ncbi:MAG: hypothetical protein AMK72_06555 [Planctomycetes bacterium SM23_25]|nr:MAG: hypothetical protein AMK72_06555 [Planctomycetes bacterium SM23_25]
MQLTRDNLQLLPQLLDEIHDRYFDLQRVQYDREAGQWRLPFGDSKYGPYEHAVVVRGVREYHLQDTERIRFYCINELKFSLETESVILTCDVPIGIRLDVQPDFVVSLE